MFVEQYIYVHEQVIKVHCVRQLAPLAVCSVQLRHVGHVALEVACLQIAVQCVVRGEDEVVLRHTYPRCHGRRLVYLVIEAELLDECLYQTLRVAVVVYREVGLIAQLACLRPQYPREYAVESSHIDIACLVAAHYGVYPLLHLVCRLVRKGQRQDVPWFHATHHQICHLIREHARLARTRTGNHQRRPVAIFHGRALAVIESIEEC